MTSLADPLEYDSSAEGLLEMSALRIEMKELCTRLFPDPDPTSGQPAAEEPTASTSDNTRPEGPQLGFAEKLAAQFKEDLETMGKKKKKTTTDVAAEMALASKTGVLTDRLKRLQSALESVQASSVESERAFSSAGRFATKIRNRLGDKTLDSYCFALHKYQTEKRQVAMIIFVLEVQFV